MSQRRQQLKILTVVFDLGKGGTQRAAQNFCEGYAVLGHDSRLLAIDGSGHRRQELETNDIFVWAGDHESVILEIAEWQPDIVHLHTIGINTAIVERIRNNNTRARFVETNVFSESSQLTNYVERSFQLSRWAAFNYIARSGSATKCSIVPNPIKTDNFYRSNDKDRLTFRRMYNIPETSFVFGRVGQSFIDKWSLDLIDLFVRFHQNVDSHAILLLVNPPVTVVEYARQRNIMECVVTIDVLRGDDQLRNCYSSIDVFLHIANQGESFGLVLAESLLCETPVITLNTPWSDNSQSEVVAHTIGGFCANTLNQFFEHMKTLHLDEAFRRKLGTSGRESIRTRYDYRAVAARSLDLLTIADQTTPTVESVVRDLKLESFNYNFLVRRLLKIKITWFRHRLHSSLSHRIINLLIRTSCGYRVRRTL
jgi:glycosyltransferase involved in cell wall biosynthesis